MLDYLKNLLGSNKGAPAKQAVSAKAVATQKSAVGPKSQAAPGAQGPARRARTSPRNAKTREEMTIHRQDRVPKHERVLSVEGGEIYLTPLHRNHYIVLKINPDDEKVVIISSLEKSETPGIDNDFASLLDQCKSRGYQLVARFYAKSQIIQLIYQDSTGNKGQKDEISDPKSYQLDFDKMIKKAIEMSISDIHIEVGKDSAEIRDRIDGSLIFGDNWTREYAVEMAIVIYQVIAEEKDVTFKMNEPQSAVIVRTIDEHQVRVRLNTIPSYPNGFDMILRVFLEGAENHRKISDSGYFPEQIDLLEDAASDHTGVIILAGSTGSGKSTSVAAIVSERIEAHTFNGSSSIKVITVEDPPENAIKFTTQVPVVRSRKLEEGESAFSPYIRAAMRSDPDVLMVGEVRDKASAELLMSAVQSGHAVITTIHAPSAIGIMSRLRSNVMGLPNDVLGGRDFISALVYQTLIPLICKNCCLTLDEFEKTHEDRRSKQLVERIQKITSDEQRKYLKFKNDNGCSQCNEGKKGRIVVAETIRPNDEMKKLFTQGKDFEALQLFFEQGGKPIQYYGYLRMLEGICDARDVETKLGRLHPEKVFEHELAIQAALAANLNSSTESLPGASDNYSFKSKLLGESEHAAEIRKLELVKKDQSNSSEENDDKTT